MTIFEAIDEYRKLHYKNNKRKGLGRTDANRIYELRQYIEEHIIEAIQDGYVLTLSTEEIEDENIENKPNLEQWKDYLAVQKSGVTNMIRASVVCSYSKHGLTCENCYYIYENYTELCDEYKFSMQDLTKEEMHERMGM